MGQSFLPEDGRIMAEPVRQVEIENGRH